MLPISTKEFWLLESVQMASPPLRKIYIYLRINLFQKTGLVCKDAHSQCPREQLEAFLLKGFSHQHGDSS